MEKEEKKKLKFWDKAIGTIILFVILFLIGNTFGSILPVVCQYSPGIPTEWSGLLSNYIPVAITGVAFWIYMGWKDKESLKTMGPKYGNNGIKTFLWGLLAGLAANGGLALLACASGNFSLKFKGMNFGFSLVAIVCVAAQCIAEEIMNRVFLYQRFKRSNGPWFAIIMNAVVFSALHISNLFTYKVQPMYAVIALVNIVLIAVFFSETVYFGNNVWFAFAFHTAWNFCQNYILGLPNSGKPSTASIFAIEGEGTDGFLYSAKFGIEAAWGTTILVSILIVLTYVFGKKKLKKQENA